MQLDPCRFQNSFQKTMKHTTSQRQAESYTSFYFPEFHQVPATDVVDVVKHGWLTKQGESIVIAWNNEFYFFNFFCYKWIVWKPTPHYPQFYTYQILLFRINILQEVD